MAKTWLGARGRWLGHMCRYSSEVEANRESQRNTDDTSYSWSCIRALLWTLLPRPGRLLAPGLTVSSPPELPNPASSIQLPVRETQLQDLAPLGPTELATSRLIRHPNVQASPVCPANSEASPIFPVGGPGPLSLRLLAIAGRDMREHWVWGHGSTGGGLLACTTGRGAYERCYFEEDAAQLCATASSARFRVNLGKLQVPIQQTAKWQRQLWEGACADSAAALQSPMRRLPETCSCSWDHPSNPRGGRGPHQAPFQPS